MPAAASPPDRPSDLADITPVEDAGAESERKPPPGGAGERKPPPGAIPVDSSTTPADPEVEVEVQVRVTGIDKTILGCCIAVALFRWIPGGRCYLQRRIARDIKTQLHENGIESFVRFGGGCGRGPGARPERSCAKEWCLFGCCGGCGRGVIHVYVTSAPFYARGVLLNWSLANNLAESGILAEVQIM